MKIKLILVTFLFCIHAYNTVSQVKFGLEGNVGFSVPTNTDLSDVYGAGLNLEFAVPIALLNDSKLRLKPFIGTLWYFKEVEEVNSVTEQTRIFKYGMEVEYLIPITKKINLSPFINVTNNFITNYYSSTSYNPFDDTSTFSESDDFMTGDEVGMQLGTFIRIKQVFFKLGYSILQPTLDVNQLIIDDLEDQGIIVESSADLNFNAVNISIGYTYLF